MGEQDMREHISRKLMQHRRHRAVIFCQMLCGSTFPGGPFVPRFCQLGFGGTEIEPNTVAERIYGFWVSSVHVESLSALSISLSVCTSQVEELSEFSELSGS